MLPKRESSREGKTEKAEIKLENSDQKKKKQKKIPTLLN